MNTVNTFVSNHWEVIVFAAAMGLTALRATRPAHAPRNVDEWFNWFFDWLDQWANLTRNPSQRPTQPAEMPANPKP